METFFSLSMFMPLVILGLLGLIPANIAKNKGKSFVTWWIYGTTLFFIALIHALLMKADAKKIEEDAISDGGRKCPFCAEVVKAEAKVCRHCQRDLPTLEKIVQNANSLGTCPNCSKHILLGSARCDHCSAIFDGGGWKVLPLS